MNEMKRSALTLSEFIYAGIIVCTSIAAADVQAINGARDSAPAAPSEKKDAADDNVEHFANRKAPWRVVFKEGWLDVAAEHAPLAQLMQEVARRTGVAIVGLDKLEGKISVRFSGLAVDEGLGRLLAEVSHVLVMEPTPQGSTRVRQVLILEMRKAPDPASPPLAVPLQSDAPGDELAEEKAKAAKEVKHAAQRLEAIESAALAGDLDALRAALRDSDSVNRSRALDLLAEANPEEAAAQVLEMTKSDKPGIRLQALELLNDSEIADEETVVSSLGSALAAADETVKAYAVEALAERGGSEAIAYLKEAFHDSDPEIKRLIIGSAAPHDEQKVLLEEARYDEDDSVRSIAVGWLRQDAGSAAEGAQEGQ